MRCVLRWLPWFVAGCLMNLVFGWPQGIIAGLILGFVGGMWARWMEER